jgi:hypothetical protein
MCDSSGISSVVKVAKPIMQVKKIIVGDSWKVRKVEVFGCNTCNHEHANEIQWRRSKVVELRARGMTHGCKYQGLQSLLTYNTCASRLKELSKNTLLSIYLSTGNTRYHTQTCCCRRCSYSRILI